MTQILILASAQTHDLGASPRLPFCEAEFLSAAFICGQQDLTFLKAIPKLTCPLCFELFNKL